MKKDVSARVIGTLFLAGCCIIGITPIALGIMRSLFIDSAFTEFNYFSSYREVVHTEQILPAFINSILIVILSVPMNVGVVVLASYGLSKYHFKGQGFIYLMLLSALMIPPATVMYPCFMIIRDLGLINSIFAVILTEVAYGIPFNLLMAKNYFDDIPDELMEAARIDGAGSFRILHSILVPVAKPVLFVIVLWSFLGAWNDYMWPMLFFSDSSKKTVTLLPQYFMSAYSQRYDNLFAALFIIMIPTIIIYISLQKYFEQGLVSGAIKQ